jgi:hypothetical protein
MCNLYFKFNGIGAMNPLASEGGMKRTNILFRRFGIVRKNVGFPIFLF